MFRTVEDFVQAWKIDSESTHKMLLALDDASLNTKMDQEGRTLGKIAWHLVETLPEMLPSAGLVLEFVAGHEVPESAQAIAEAYAEGAALLAKAVAAQWTDSHLLEVTNMYGFQWPRGVTLHVLLMHQAHHRGQISVLARQAGLAIPGVVGPSREEWANMGLPILP